MIPVYLKANDTLPRLEVTVSGNGAAVDLSSATGVHFLYKKRFSGVATEGTGDFVNKGSGIVFYDWVANDTDEIGPYFGEFRIFYANTGRRSYPNDSYLVFEVHSGLL